MIEAVAEEKVALETPQLRAEKATFLEAPLSVLKELDQYMEYVAETAFYFWPESLFYIRELAQKCPEKHKTEFAKRLMSGLLSTLSINKAELEQLWFHREAPVNEQPKSRRAIRNAFLGVDTSYIEMFIDGVLQVAIAADRSAAQSRVADLLISVYTTRESPFENYIGEYLASKKEMFSVDSSIVQKEGASEFQYWGKTIKIVPPEPKAVVARDMLSGLGVLIEDERGLPIGVCAVHFVPIESMDAEQFVSPMMSLEEFNDKFYYGQPIDLDRIKNCLDDIDDEYLTLIRPDVNPSTFPLYARVRLREIAQDPQLREKYMPLFGYGFKIMPVLQMFDGENLYKVLDLLLELSLKIPIEYVLAPITVSSEFANVLADAGVSKEKKMSILELHQLAKLLETKSRDQLLEFANIYAARGELFRDSFAAQRYNPDLDLLFTAQASLAVLAHAVVEAQKPGVKPEQIIENLGIKFPPDAIPQVLDFVARNPEAPTCFQTLFDLAIVTQFIVQRDAPYAQNYAAAKAEFYTEYNKANQMNKDGATTDTSTDFYRNKSVIEHAVRVAKENGKQPSDMRVLLVGIGNAQRLEGPLLRELASQGIAFGEVLGVDLNDTSESIPQDLFDELNLRFKVANITQDEIKGEGQFDLILFPWSIVTDILAKDDLLHFLQTLRGLLTDDGIADIDIPLPIGEHSYRSVIAEQQDFAQGAYGIMERGFAGYQGEIRSVFNVMLVREVVMHLFQAGLLPDNFPLDLSEQAQLVQRIDQDDSNLTEQAKQVDGRAANYDAMAHPMWQGGGYNRVTFAVRKGDLEEVQEKVGLGPSYLIAKLSQLRQTADN